MFELYQAMLPVVASLVVMVAICAIVIKVSRRDGLLRWVFEATFVAFVTLSLLSGAVVLFAIFYLWLN